MNNQGRVGFWSFLLGMPVIVMFSGGAVAFKNQTSQGTGMLWGLLVGCGLTLFVLLLDFLLNPKATGQDEQGRAAPTPREQHREAKRERDEELAVLKAANIEDPMVVEAQRQEIEANYERKVAQRE